MSWLRKSKKPTSFPGPLLQFQPDAGIKQGGPVNEVVRKHEGDVIIMLQVWLVTVKANFNWSPFSVNEPVKLTDDLKIKKIKRVNRPWNNIQTPARTNKMKKWYCRFLRPGKPEISPVKQQSNLTPFFFFFFFFASAGQQRTNNKILFYLLGPRSGIVPGEIILYCTTAGTFLLYCVTLFQL